jgi:hypothetical protein
MRPNFTDDLASAIVEQFEPVETPPPPTSKPIPDKTWEPDLNPTQKLAFHSSALNVLMEAEKASGKSICAGYMGVRHAYDNDNALVLIITPSLRSGFEGLWYDMDTLILPAWKDGIGLEYTASKLDPLTKDRHRWIRNRYGGWSKILLMSIQYSVQVEHRVKAWSPSMVIVEELTNCDGREYFVYPKLQLGRRRGITGPQQFVATCNPEGPSHWVFKVFHVECVDEKTGIRDKDFSIFHIPFTENAHRVPRGYMEQLQKTLKNDPTEYRRLVGGEWVDRPRGDGILTEYWNQDRHCKGDIIKGEGLLPRPGWPIHIGYDLGQMWSAIIFEQFIPMKDKNVIIIFDEICKFYKRTLYKSLAWEVIERMRFWKKTCNFEFQYMHITDESAINQYRPGTGSYDAMEFEKEFNKAAPEFSKDIGAVGVRQIKMIGCPKGQGSISARIRLLQSKLWQDELFVSATCKNVRDMMGNLEADKEDPEKPKRQHPYVDVFDACSYPMFKESLGGRLVFKQAEVAPRLIRVGSG